MGNLISQPNQKDKRSDAIDRQIEEDSRIFKRECKILILGSQESQKSIVNGLKRNSGLSEQEHAVYRSKVCQTVLYSAQAIILAMRKFEMDFGVESNTMFADKVMNCRVDEGTPFTLSPDIAYAIHQLWSDPVMSKVLDQKDSEFHLMDGAPYLLDHVLRIGSPDYLPTEADISRVSEEKSTGIEEIRLTVGQLSLCIYYVGCQRTEYRKWIHCFETVTNIIFCVALTDYDQVLPDNSNKTRLMETLILFGSVINSRWFLNTTIILFLNEIDEFKKKLARVPLERYFPEYTGGNDINKATKYILWKFMQFNRARLSVYPHLTRGDDPANIRLISAAVKETILANALKASRCTCM
ncbi:hypothetical protein GYMLUDRAFT_265031 [Collybiopsis luxurians FD-317 M1]|uniref:Guanine nucleotide-binding protein alpha-3 subunit n=1 Tax=Collybiopsis luxurians FD-317 M1 TaxID=944289 RepID=A0A0D0ASN9_9AGAR|nr:hypothetical protein GYMLUDRAFT_265031 [Collybiopsis luxurians FD-317 M1]